MQTPDSGSFRQRLPWIGPDLQTLRDTLHPDRLPNDLGRPWTVALPDGGSLLVLEDQPLYSRPMAWVLLVHGLAGSSNRLGVRRLANALQAAGLGVWRLNLRGAGAGRALAPGTYAASCNRDLLPLLSAMRRRAAGLPLMGAGLSMGGTVLLNALLEQPDGLDALACVSSPLDLAASAEQIEAPRNSLYQLVLLRRLIRQTLADPFQKHRFPAVLPKIRSIRQFDSIITVPRWGYDSVEQYYLRASPLPSLIKGSLLIPSLFLHAQDDPWVPASSILDLQQHSLAGLHFCLPLHGGHNGFHGTGNWERLRKVSWADSQVVQWLVQRCG